MTTDAPRPDALQQALRALVDARRDLTETEAAQAMDALMSGDASPAQAGAFLTALRMKGETVDEIVGFARVMRSKALRVDLPGLTRIADTAGTGGDGQNTFNASTAAAFVAAGCGVIVAKHGNRSASGRVGSADVLEALGARIDLPPQLVAECIQEVGIGFMFAQAFHPAMKHVAPVRRELGIRTVFNLLGPLTNPAGATHQVVGVPTEEIGKKLAQALARLGPEHALVVWGHEGLDEVSPAGPSTVWDVRGGNVSTFTVSPDQFGIRSVPLEFVQGDSAEANARAMEAVLGGPSATREGKGGALHGFVVMNAAAALLAADEVPSFAEGISRAAECMDDGRARRKLERFIEVSARLGGGS